MAVPPQPPTDPMNLLADAVFAASNAYIKALRTGDIEQMDAKGKLWMKVGGIPDWQDYVPATPVPGRVDPDMVPPHSGTNCPPPETNRPNRETNPANHEPKPLTPEPAGPQMTLPGLQNEPGQTEEI